MGKIRMRSRARTLKAAVAAVALGGAMVLATGPAAFAVHDEAFQLDGDVSASTTTTKGGVTQTIDWDSFFDSAGAEKTLPTDFTASVFTKDFNNNGTTFLTSDASTYTTGSKDTLPISTGWQCTASNNVNSKVDVMNAYAAAYTDPVTKDQLLYFALERNVNTGDANVAFWFLQDEVGCVSNDGTASFTGDHQDGDLLIVSAFTNGGTVSTVDVYRWERPDPDLLGSLNQTPVAAAHGADCTTTAPGDNACATVNTETITTPWLTANRVDGVGHSLRSTEFYEGGLNLTASGLGGHCFNSFTGDTRSSQSLTATLFDYSLGALGECTSSIVTTPSITSPTTIPASGSITGVTDGAALTVTGISTFSGTITWSICGPLALTSTTNCKSGGDQVGDALAVTAAGNYTSPAVEITSAGRYCWRAEFSGDSTAGVPASSDPPATGTGSDSTSECFKVNPVQPTLDTDAGDGPVDFGQPVTDEATLTGTANQPGSGGIGSDESINPTTAGAAAGGTITFTLYKSDCTTKATGTGDNPQTVNVSGDSPAGDPYGPVSFTPDEPGTYYWVAEYSGDDPNTLKADHNTTCTADPDEAVVVRQIPTEIKTDQKVYPNDSATVTSSVTGKNLPSGGTVTFRLYDTVENCKLYGDTVDTVGTGGLLYKELASITGGAQSEAVATHNWPGVAGVTPVAVDADSTVAWYVTYTTGDNAFTGRQSNCVETTALDFTNHAGPGDLYPTPTP